MEQWCFTLFFLILNVQEKTRTTPETKRQPREKRAKIIQKNVPVKLFMKPFQEWCFIIINTKLSDEADGGIYYEKTLGIKISCIIDEKNQLPSSSCGGVILGSLDWTIKCSNTLQSRLELLQDQV